MAKILLDYVFPVSIATGTPAASTGFLKRAALVCKPKAGQEANVGELYSCTSMADVAARTDNENAEQLFAAGMTQVFILLATTLDLATYMETHAGEFFTLLVSDDFTDADVGGVKATLVQGDLTFTAVGVGAAGNAFAVEALDTVSAGAETVTVADGVVTINMEGGVSTAAQIAAAFANSEDALALMSVTVASGQSAVAQAAFSEANLANGADAIDVGAFPGVIGVSSTSKDFAAAQAATANRSGFFAGALTKAKNMCFAFGSLLANLSNWTNQQFISMPVDDGVSTLGDANALFDDKVSFVIHDDEFSNRLALFAVGGKAIIAPYVLKHLSVNLQSRALQWISANEPQYTVKEAALLESALQEDVIQKQFINRGWIESGEITISLIEDNFVANGFIEVPEPRALWRVFNEMLAT